MHCPMNISRSFSNMLREFIQEKGDGDNDNFEVFDEPHRLEHESALLKNIRGGNTPALYIGHATDFGRLQQQEILNNFEKLPDLPLAERLKSLGFEDSRQRFHPFTVIPFGVIYNKYLVGENRVLGWEDLNNPKYHGKIRIPDRERTISKVIESAMKMNFPDSYEQFIDNCTFNGSPIDVVNSVDEGEYHYGMVNIAFSRFSRLKNTGIIWMDEGAFCMPQVIAIGKGKYDMVREIVEYIFSQHVQDFMALQGFIPAVSGEVPSILKHEELRLIWNGWENFLKSTA